MHTVAISGASGFIGSALTAALRERGVRVRPLVRPAGRQAADGIHWDPEAGTVDSAALEGVDALVHLAGESVASRWTRELKVRIRDSRVRSTELLANALGGLTRKPAVFISASAIGFYGDRGEEPVDERSPPGRDFLADTSLAWESAAEPAARAGIRVVHPRIGIILDPRGGALQKMLPPFKLGVGGRMGSGRQYMSWMALPDAVRALLFLLEQPGLSGAFNLTSPQPATNAEFTRTLAHVLHRPAVMSVPAFALRAALGEFAEVALLGGARVLPTRLLEAGFTFEHAELGPFLQHVLHAS